MDLEQVELELINEQEVIFGWNPTVNPTIAAGLTELEPYESFFKTVADSQRNIQSWYSEPIINLVPEQVKRVKSQNESVLSIAP